MSRISFVPGLRANEIPCDYCGAKVGEPCRVASGAVAQSPHSKRMARSACLDREAIRLARWDAESEIRSRRTARVADLRATYGPRWRYADERAADRPKGDPLREKWEVWPDGPPDEHRPGDWYCYRPKGAPMERRMFLGPHGDPYHGPVLATVVDTGSRFRWEAAYNGPGGAYDEYDRTHAAGYCDDLLTAFDCAERAAWGYLVQFPDAYDSAVNGGATPPEEPEE